jgi:hypothetical protein
LITSHEAEPDQPKEVDMSEATRYVPEKDVVDWSELAELVFPAEALRPAPAIAGLGFKAA